MSITVDDLDSVSSLARSESLSTILSMGVVAVLLLVALLVIKELASVSDRPRARYLARTVDIAIVPLAFGFLTIIVAKLGGVTG